MAGVFSEEEFQSLKELEGKKELLDKEIEWRLKSRAIWLAEGEIIQKRKK